MMSNSAPNNTPKPAHHTPLHDALHPMVVWGGDVVLGRRQHFISTDHPDRLALDVAALREADLAIVNLECVVATRGEQGCDKGEGSSFFFRARPEMLQVLLDAGVDAVTVANNHAGDYGPDALMEQGQWLGRVGLPYAGAGQGVNEAFQPMLLRAGALDVAVFSIDATQYHFAAEAQRPGIAYLDIKQFANWRARLEPLFAQARRHADVVLVAMHWDNGNAVPNDEKIAAGHALIDAGADCVMGASSHLLQGIDIYRGKPILHDAGDLLTDFVGCGRKKRSGGVFKLHLDRKGVFAVRFMPVGIGFGHTVDQVGDAARLGTQAFAEQCAAMHTHLEICADHSGLLMLRPPAHPIDALPRPDAARPPIRPSAEVAARALDVALRSPQPEWLAAYVPHEARLSQPLRVGPLILLGLRATPSLLTRRQMLYVESFWFADQALATNVRLDIRASAQEPSDMPDWGGAMDHDPCDWMMPTSRWQPGQIYRDFVGLRLPPNRDLRNSKMNIVARTIGGGHDSPAQRVPGVCVEFKRA